MASKLLSTAHSYDSDARENIAIFC